ncbi:MAG: phosphatidylserine decarboxylase family protein [Zetaproteobacteria bacterium]|nr:MAG: phosphatidylserine decarboxylase family protein [Zetaproteobacteria bacterium]
MSRAHTRYGLAREGWPFIVPVALSLPAALLAGWCVASGLLLLLLLFLLNFFRDPERRTPTGEGLIVAPADGKVVRAEGDASGGRIDIFMNVFNVHVNRAPCAGRIEAMRYHPGRFINASLDKASEENERNRITLRSDDGARITVVQIAGLVARRIVSYVAVGDRVEAGQRIGMIRFGSRVDCLLPEGFQPVVAVGEKVVAGETVIARRAERS